MGESKTVWLTRPQADAIEDMVDSDVADSDSEAFRVVFDRGLAEMGYRSGENEAVPDGGQSVSGIQLAARRLRDAFALLGIMWVGLTFVLPLELRALAAGPFAASLACVGVEQAAGRWDWTLGLGGETA